MYYHDIITAKSWKELKKLTKIIDFTLIGGWASYLYTKALKSKDIDIIANYDQLGKLREKYEIIKNDRLKKYEARHGEIQIDIYLPHYSTIGIPTEHLLKNNISLEGFTVLKKEYLTSLKIFVFGQRLNTPKGEKDFLDIISLFMSGVNTKILIKIITKYKMKKELDQFLKTLSERKNIKELNINNHKYKKIKEDIISSF